MSKKTTTSKKNTKKNGMLPKMELLIIFVFFMSFIVWAMSKCDSTQIAYEQKAAKESVASTESTEPKAEPLKQTNENTIATTATKSATPNNPKVITKTEKVTVLYVILDGLKLRKGHHLDSSIVRTLKLNDEVYFLNEVTDFKQEINLGNRMAIEPWIKVRAYSGHEGWVYGAGVHYFKPKPNVDTLIN